MAGNETLTYEVLHANIVKFENNIINTNVTLLQGEQAVILGSSSIMRHSLAFWQEELGVGTPAYAPVETTTTTVKKKKWWHWMIIGASDVAGGLVGSTIEPGGTIGGATLASGMAKEIITENL